MTAKQVAAASAAMGVSRFVELANARSFAEKGVKSLMVVMGDDERFWVMVPAMAAKLEKAGYEVL